MCKTVRCICVRIQSGDFAGQQPAEEHLYLARLDQGILVACVQVLREAGEALLLTSDVDLASRRRGAWDCVYAARPAAEFAMLSLVRCGMSASVSVTVRSTARVRVGIVIMVRVELEARASGALHSSCIVATLSAICSAVCHLK